MLHTICLFISQYQETVALQFYSFNITLHSRNNCNISIKGKMCCILSDLRLHKMLWINTGVENIIKQLFWCDCIGPMQCVEYYCVFMQLPMSNHSIDHTDATLAAFPGLDIVTYSNIALSYETQNAKHKFITFFLLEKCIFELSTLDLEGHLMLGFIVLYGWWLWCSVKMGLLYRPAHPPIAGLKPFPTKVHTAQV